MIEVGDRVRITGLPAGDFWGLLPEPSIEVVAEIDSKDGRATYSFESGRWAYADECEPVDA